MECWLRTERAAGLLTGLLIPELAASAAAAADTPGTDLQDCDPGCCCCRLLLLLELAML
jgi:hypothetical protein